jgi:AcrR family transcriptional regulator
MKAARRQPRHDARQARTDVYRQHIFEAAEQVFAERGFEAATLQEIGKRVGLSMGTIYSVFPSKLDMLQAILDARGQEILELVRGVSTRALSARAALNGLLEGYVDFFVGHPAFLQMHLRQGSAWILSPGNGGSTRAAVWTEIHSLQADIFGRGVDDGTFVAEEPGFLAKLFSAIDQVLLADWVDNGMKAPREELLVRLQAIVERVFCKRPRAGRGPRD